MAETMAADLSQIFPWMNQLEKVVDEAPTDLSLQKDHSVDRTIEEEERLDVESTDDKTEEADEPETAPSTGSAQSNGSSSRRKNCAPQRNEQGLTKQEINDELEHMIEEDTANEASGEISALQNQLNSPSKLSEMLDAQKRLYASILEQQQKKEAERRPQLTQQTFGKLAATLKAEIIEQLSGSIDKIVSDFAASEMARLASQQSEAQPRQPIGLFHPMYMHTPMHNPFAVPQGPPTGIFPPAFNPFSQLAALSAARRAEDGEPRRKRSKLCSEIKSKLGTPLGRESPDAASDSPRLNTQASLSAYFPPTMVGHPLYGAGIFGERDESPVNSDEMSECGPYVEGQSSTLTPMHLRKAKLMFFYSRYPNSAMLKSYFPDIRFNKNNTAQLVKWFSNFREFYYIQMEKFARQALAEGIVNREDLHVSIESELFKQLNQHYNRNNHLQPPERLVFVVQETLREFFDAIKLGKDLEPSWKKTIYKVIARLDDAIPDYFKDPAFLERLE